MTDPQSPEFATSPSVRFTLDEAGFLQGCQALWAYRAIGGRGNYLLAAILFVCGGVLAGLGTPRPVALALVLGAVLLVAMDRLRDRLWRRYYRGLAKYQSPVTAILSERGVLAETLEGRDLTPWRQFQSFAHTDHHLFLIVDQRQFSIIPLDAFATTTEAAAFEDMVARHLRRLPRRLM